jgi:hypothetical protein
MSPESKSQRTRPAMRAGRAPAVLLAILVLAAASIAFASSAVAAIPFCLPGEGPGQCKSPKGVATDWETGHVYVVDQGNHRINVFDADGTFLSSFGSAQLTAPTQVAVDNDATSPSRHDVYVSADNFEVQKFKASGEFIESFGGEGKGVCQLTHTYDPVAVGPGGAVNVADSYDKDGEGPLHIFVNRIQRFDSEGKCLGEVKLSDGENSGLVSLVVDSLGNFYYVPAARILKYSPAGTLIADLGGVETQSLAIDAADNVFAKQRGNAVTRSANTYFIAEYAPDTSLIKRFSYTIPPKGQDRPVPGLAAFEDGTGAEGVFASEGSAGIDFLQIPKGPIIVPEPCHVKNGEPGSVRATLQAEINPEGKETHFHFEYTTGSETKNGPSEALGGPADFELHEAAQTVVGLNPETTYHCRVVAENAEGTTPPGEEGSFETQEGFVFGLGTVSEVGTEEATLTAEGNPLGLPATAQIEYVEEAKFEESRFAEAQSVPAEELDYGAGEAMQSRSATLTGLAPTTTYHWRLHVRNGVPPQGLFCPRNKPEPCPANEHVFRTYGAEEKADERAWELVSPGQKNNAEVGTPELASGAFEERFLRILASSGSGEAATYTSFTSFGKEAEGAPSSSQYLSKRTAGGWVTENISPFGYQEPVLFIPFKGFAPDLSLSVFKVSKGVLAPGCPEGVENLYLRDNASGIRTCLTQEVPQEGDIRCFVYAGSSEDGSRTFFASSASYAGVPKGLGFSLYEWSAEGGLEPLSVLPGQSAPAVPTQGTVFGPTTDPVHPNTISNCQFGQTVIRHAVSADGSKAFWTYVPEARMSVPKSPGVQELTVVGAGAGTFALTFGGKSTQPIALGANAATIQTALESLSTVGAGNVEVSGSGPFTITLKGTLAGTSDPIFVEIQSATQLLARLNNTETIQLDAKPEGQKKEKPGVAPFGNGVFQAASKDGSVVYFTDTGRLTSSSKAEAGKPDLYRYEFGKAEPLSDLTKGAVPGNVQGVTGASDDGSYIYFVAKGALSGEEEGPTGQKAIEGANNLYLYHEGKTGFIARLSAEFSAEDQNDWTGQPKRVSARVTPDGKHLAFLSVESQALAGYDNTIAEGQHCGSASPLCAQGFVYDAEADTLSCATCNPTGARPLGPTRLPGWSNPFEGPRYLSDDGSRFFFESFDALLGADENEKLDVYEFERPGTGSCTTGSGNFDPASGGCHYLVSTGKSEDESYLVDASSNGRDVFFSTRQALVGWDPNENYDVYDYRDGGGFPEPAETPNCLGESCKAPASAAPPPGTATTPGFFGSGNPKAEKQKPARHKKKHRKAKKKPHAKKRGARR